MGCFWVRALVVFRRGQLLQTRRITTQKRQQRRIAYSRKLAGDDLKQSCPNLKYLTDFTRRQIGHQGTSPHEDGYQTLTFQNTDRVSHRSAADMELRSQFLLEDAGARRQGI